MSEMLSEKEIETIRALRSQGYKLSYIVYKTGRSTKSILKYAGRKENYYWTKEEVEKAVSLRNQGFKYKQIAEQLNKNPMTIGYIFYRLREKASI